jgi:hypothetical protein
VAETVDGTIVDDRIKYESVKGTLVAGETLDAVFDVKGTGTGVLGISSKRLILGDKAVPSDLGHITSVPYSRVYWLRCEAGTGGLLGGSSSKLVVETAGATIELEFKGRGKARQAHDLILLRLG